MEKVCKKWHHNWIISPLCWDWELLWKLKAISEVKWVSLDFMLSVSYAESHLWTNFAPSMNCSWMNNWWWVKGLMDNQGNVSKIKLPYKWCWLYPFASVEDYFKSLANTLKMWYADAWCNNASCLSTRYVGGKWWVKQWWVNRVEWF